MQRLRVFDAQQWRQNRISTGGYRSGSSCAPARSERECSALKTSRTSLMGSLKHMLYANALFVLMVMFIDAQRANKTSSIYFSTHRHLDSAYWDILQSSSSRSKPTASCPPSSLNLSSACRCSRTMLSIMPGKPFTWNFKRF